MKRKYIPETAQEKQDYADGVAAFAVGVAAGNCPFAWFKVGKPEPALFEANYRIRLNMWMQGWIDAKEISRVDHR